MLTRASGFLHSTCHFQGCEIELLMGVNWLRYPPENRGNEEGTSRAEPLCIPGRPQHDPSPHLQTGLRMPVDLWLLFETRPAARLRVPSSCLSVCFYDTVLVPVQKPTNRPQTPKEDD